MTRLSLLAVMVTTSVVVVLTTGIAWLRQAPVPPANLRDITQGMTIGEVERLIGHPLTCGMSCTGNYYYIDVQTSWIAGQGMTLSIAATPWSYDPLTKQSRALTHEQEICRRVRFERWSRIAALNHQEWLRPLLALGRE